MFQATSEFLSYRSAIRVSEFAHSAREGTLKSAELDKGLMERFNIGVCLILAGPMFCVAAPAQAQTPPISWVPPATFDSTQDGLGSRQGPRSSRGFNQVSSA